MFKLTVLLFCCIGALAFLLQAEAFTMGKVMRLNPQQLQRQNLQNKALFLKPQRLVTSSLMAHSSFHAPEGVDASLQYSSVSTIVYKAVLQSTQIYEYVFRYLGLRVR